MFERKNQTILSTHYKKLVDHDADGVQSDADADDFITLKRADHELSDAEQVPPDVHAENLSRRKLKLGKAKRAVLKYGGLARKVVFDEEGNAHDLYEMEDADEFFKDGMEGAKQAGKQFAEGERGKIKERDVVDKEEAREKKREKKRKRKEKEKGVCHFVFCLAQSAWMETHCLFRPRMNLVQQLSHCLTTMAMFHLTSTTHPVTNRRAHLQTQSGVKKAMTQQWSWRTRRSLLCDYCGVVIDKVLWCVYA
jgi:hypothetical protein